MSKAKAKATTSGKPLPSSPDEALIRACVHYALAVSAVHAAFTADPDGNSTYAEPIANKCERRANKALAVISSTPAATFAGINAKARIVEALLHDNNDMSKKSAAFLASFAADVKTQSEAVLEAEWVAARKAVQS